MKLSPPAGSQKGNRAGRIQGAALEARGQRGQTYQSRGSKGAIDIEQADGVLERALLERRVSGDGGGSGSHCDDDGVFGVVVDEDGTKGQVINPEKVYTTKLGGDGQLYK